GFLPVARLSHPEKMFADEHLCVAFASHWYSINTKNPRKRLGHSRQRQRHPGGEGMLRWIRIAIAIAVGSLLIIASEAGAAEFGNAASGDAAYLWSGSFSDSKAQGASDGATPSSSSAKQMTSNRGSSSAATVRDPSAKQAVDKLTATVTPGDSAYKI